MILLGWVETSPANIRGALLWASTSASVTSPVSLHPTSTEPKMPHTTGSDVSYIYVTTRVPTSDSHHRRDRAGARRDGSRRVANSGLRI